VPLFAKNQKGARVFVPRRPICLLRRASDTRWRVRGPAQVDALSRYLNWVISDEGGLRLRPASTLLPIVLIPGCMAPGMRSNQFETFTNAGIKPPIPPGQCARGGPASRTVSCSIGFEG